MPYDGPAVVTDWKLTITNKTALIAVVVAFLAGMLATLAIRPPGEGSVSAAQNEEGVAVEVRWRVPVAFATTLEVLGDNVIWVTDAIRRSSNGAIVLEPFEPGEVVPPLNIVDAVREGKVQAGYTWLGYDQGKIPASPLLGAVPFGMEPWEYTAWWFEAGGCELAEALYAKYDVHPLLCGLIGPETAGWFRSPIESLDDLEGLKIRFAGLGGKVIERLGASVTMLPGGEIFQALEKGAIDATEFSLPNVDEQLGFDRIAKLNYYPGWHQPYTAAHMVVNIEEWRALTAAQQAVIDTACTGGVTRNLANSEAKQGPILAGFPAKGVTPIVLPEPILRQLNEVADDVMAEEAANDEDFRIIHESQLAFRAQYARWKRFAYLPRDF
ncbi:MAG: TRAP transporter substrate-binding protein [Gammaproteobacteria bacterium]|nr:TRAP transporter substrate-binding protein [Gammaproteobacteria bacterium]